MKMIRLSNEKLRELAVGYVGVEEEDGLLRFYKYTPEQVVGFGPWEHKNKTCGATTGIRFDFYTNSKSIAFSPATAGKYEFLVDGLLRKHILVGDEENGADMAPGGRFETELSDTLGRKKDEYRITIYLPSHCVGQIAYISLDDGAYARRYEYSRKFLIIGDSITQGWDSKYDSLSYANRISRFFDAESVVQGRGGSIYNENTVVKLPNFDPEVVIVAYGTNDYVHHNDMNEFKRRISLYHDNLKECYGDKKIFIISPIWRTLRDVKLNFVECCEFIRDEAERHGFIYIDGAELMPPINEDFYTDGLHPTDLGFSFYAESLAPKIQKYL